MHETLQHGTHWDDTRDVGDVWCVTMVWWVFVMKPETFLQGAWCAYHFTASLEYSGEAGRARQRKRLDSGCVNTQ